MVGQQKLRDGQLARFGGLGQRSSAKAAFGINQIRAVLDDGFYALKFLHFGIIGSRFKDRGELWVGSKARLSRGGADVAGWDLQIQQGRTWFFQYEQLAF